MPYNGSGSFALVTGNPVVTGTVISSTVQNNTMADIASGLTSCITRTGQSAALANLPMGGFKHTGAVAATAPGEYITQGQANAGLSSLTVGTFTTTGNVNITGSVTLGDASTDLLVVNGLLAQPNVPAVRASRSSSNQTSGSTLIFDAVNVQRNSGYDSSTGIYTVPANAGGIYWVSIQITLVNTTISAFNSGVTIRKNAIAGNPDNYSLEFDMPANGKVQRQTSGIMSLASGDTVRVSLTTGVLNGSFYLLSDGASSSVSNFSIVRIG